MEIYGHNVLTEQKKIEEKKTDSGLIIANEIFNQVEYTNRETVTCRVVGVGDECTDFIKVGDEIVTSKYNGIGVREQGKEYVMLLERQVFAKILADGSFMVCPGKVLVKMSKDDKMSLFKKKILRTDGQLVDLFVNVPAEKDDARASELFVTTGLVCAVGLGVADVRVNDVALLDYNVDNDDSIIISYDGGDKLIIVDAVTTYHDGDHIISASRKSSRDQVVWFRGDYDQTTNVVGVIRDDQIIAIDPFVFLEHESNVVHSVTKAGILYEENLKVYKRVVLAVSERSMRKYGIEKGEEVLVQDTDVFTVNYSDKKVSCINDVDILGKASLLKTLKTI